MLVLRSSVVCLSSVTYVLWLNGASYQKKLFEEAKKETAYGESNGHVINDVT